MAGAGSLWLVAQFPAPLGRVDLTVLIGEPCGFWIH